MVRQAAREAALAALLEGFAGARGILLGVSGGPDSMALMWLAAHWARQPGRPRVEVATVDHGLRSEGREEALVVARAAEKLGLPHHILAWTGQKPKSRIQERARAARYDLLEACAADIGANVLLTAHHADDQAETILFRLKRGSGIAGLAGMAACVRRGPLTHGRPFLDVPKEDLVAVCVAAGLGFVTDPSNVDPRFARTDMRRVLRLLKAEGFDREVWTRLGGRALRTQEALAYFVAQTLAKLETEAREGYFRANLAPLREAPPEVLQRILTGEVERVGRNGRPRMDRAEALADRFTEALRLGAPANATLGGALVKLDRNGVLTLRQEGGRRVSAADGDVHANCTFPEISTETTVASLGNSPDEP